MFGDITTWFIVFVRFGAYMLMFPVTTYNGIPMMVRVGLAALSAIVIMPLVPPVHLVNTGLIDLSRLMFLEVTTGVTLGLLARFLFFAVEMAGSIIATESGLMLSSAFNPITNTFGASPSLLLHWMTLILLLALDLHHWMLVGLQQSYEVIPAGGAVLTESLLHELMVRGGSMFVIALQMTAPILAASFLVTLIFSLLGRAVPQMNVFSESFPVRSIAGLAVFGLTCNLLGQHIVNHLQRIPDDFIRVARILGGVA